MNRHVLVGVGACILLIVLLDNRFDYTEYEKQWKYFLNGENPWNYGSNAYGPFHTLMAYLFEVNAKFPRFLFALVSILASYFLITKIQRSALNEKTRKASFYLLLYNPIIWIMVVINGCNDGLVGFLFLFGVVLYDKERFVSSALFLSLAILYKYIPLFILPVLFVNNRMINWKFSVSTFMFLGIGFGTAYYVWGKTLLDPILFNAGRESKILSIFRYFRGDYSFLKPLGITNVDYLSTYLVVASVVLVFIFHTLYNWNWMLSLVITMLSVYLFYLVGHFQFYMSIYLILFYYVYKFGASEKEATVKKIFVLLYWIAGTTLLYGITEGFYGHFVVIREFIGLLHFLVLILTLVALVPLKSRFRQSYDPNPVG